MVKLEGHKLYSMPPLPNPRRLHIFLAEKNIDVEPVQVDVLKGEHKSEEFMGRNMDGRVPTLELDDGSHISETVAIAQYIEDALPVAEPKLFGRNLKERGRVAMWNRRVELEFINYLTTAIRYGPFNELLKWPKKPEIEKEALRVAEDYLEKLNKELATRKYVALDDQITMADLSLFAMIDFGRKSCNFKLREGELEHVDRWYKEMLERDSVKKTPGLA